MYAYSPDTGELINTTTPAVWMLTTTIAPPAFNPAIAGCFFRNGAWVIVPAQTLTLLQAQTTQIALVNNACQSALAAIIAPYPAAEVNTWQMQYNEAVAYTANNAAATPTLSALIAAAIAAV